MAFRFKGLILMLTFLLDKFSAITFAMPTSVHRSHVQTMITTHLRLQFDGCFRPPRDPDFATIPHRMAACAACIGKVHTRGNCKENESESEFCNDREMTVTPLAVGAMELPVSIETTSQHAEYEGLLMGLEWLIEFISCQNRNEKSIFEEDLTDGYVRDGDNFPLQQQGQKARVLITIEGDCKTVIDQLTGKSIPRKLEYLHQRAEHLLEVLGSMHIISADSGVDSKVNIQLKADYRHIPRSQNSISDSLCNNFMNIISAKSWMGSIRQLEEVENQIMEQQISSSKVPTVSSPLFKSFEAATRTTKHSLRPPLYEMVANLAVKTENHKLLVTIGERILGEEASLVANSNIRTRREGTEKKAGRTTASLKRKGVKYQIRGWEGLGKEKKIRFLQRKYRILLSNDDEKNDNIGKTDDFVSLFEDEKCDVSEIELSESAKPSHIRNKALKNLGDVTEGEWNALIPGVWKPMLDKWFVSARYQGTNDVIEDILPPVWVVGDV